MDRILVFLALLLAPLVGGGGFAAAQPQFQMVADTGVDATLPFEEDDERRFLYDQGYAGGAVCLGDVNGDERLDIYFCRALRGNRLYLNQGDWKFQSAGGPFEKSNSWGTGATLVDIDSDGDLDLCQVNYDAPIQFFLNDGKGGFTKVDDSFGLNAIDASLTVSFADPDNDGDLDAFVLCNTLIRPEGRPAKPPFAIQDGKPIVERGFDRYYQVVKEKTTVGWTMEEYGRRDYFFLNVGTRSKPRFRDMTSQSGLGKQGYGLSCVWWDYDEDGRMDLSVSNDYLEVDRLFHNEGVVEGVPRFRDVMGEVFPSSAWSSMGSGIADVNNDQRPDLFTVDMSARTHFKAKLNMGEMRGEQRWTLENGWPRQAMRNHLYMNAGNGRFREEAWMRGLASTDWSWAAKWGDFDSDGWNDVFVTNGMTRNFTDSDYDPGDLKKALIGKTHWDLYRDRPPMREANVVFCSQNGKRFEEVGKQWGLDLVGISYGAAVGDLDGDGDPDLVVTDLGNPLRLYKNQSEAGANASGFKVRLKGNVSNAMGIGAKVTVVDSVGTRRTRWMMPWMGFQSQDQLALHFGLGGATATKVEVVWPSGIVQEIDPNADRNTNQSTVLIEESGLVGAKPKIAKKAKEWWTTKRIAWKHDDKPFDDFALQPLLPGKLSQEGPCIAMGDLDGDGDLDGYLGAAAGQPGGLLVNFNGTLRVGAANWGGSEKCEDSAALWFDADGDGDLDLYVASGSVEFPPGDERYRDRFYRNDSAGGNLAFEGLKDSLPDLRDNGSCVAAADFDNDGDLDLFVGTRSRVGKYPLGGTSRLLRNDSRDGEIQFVDVTETAAAELSNIGLVTDGTWADLDGDGDEDLVVSIEWGSIRILWNENGQLRSSPTTSTEAKTGWWQTVSTEDVDGDGDIDLLAGNAGWNTKYGRPSDKKPAELFYGDMDGSGAMRVIEAKTGKDGDAKDVLLPVRGRSCSTHAIPSLSKSIKSYRQFALSNLNGIYGDECLEEAKHFSATELASGWWRNDGNRRFTWQPFPWEAQVSQVNAFAVGDIDADGRLECVLAQNEDAREPETGLWRCGLGVVMRMMDGEWKVIPTEQTGLAMKGAAKSVALMDANNDGRMDLLVGQNNAALLLFQSDGARSRDRQGQ